MTQVLHVLLDSHRSVSFLLSDGKCFVLRVSMSTCSLLVYRNSSLLFSYFWTSKIKSLDLLKIVPQAHVAVFRFFQSIFFLSLLLNNFHCSIISLIPSSFPSIVLLSPSIEFFKILAALMYIAVFIWSSLVVMLVIFTYAHLPSIWSLLSCLFKYFVHFFKLGCLFSCSILRVLYALWT